MLQKQKHVAELWNLTHKHDINPNEGFDYENELFTQWLSPVMFQNSNMSTYLGNVQNLSTCMIESVLEIRNLFNYTVDMYYNGHSD